MCIFYEYHSNISKYNEDFEYQYAEEKNFKWKFTKFKIDF